MNGRLVLPPASPWSGWRRLWAPCERFTNRLWGLAQNPLYHLEGLIGAIFVVLVATGIYLFLVYDIDTPFASVTALHDAWWGTWIRTVHRYAADLLVALSLLHGLRTFSERRTWGPHALAWWTGLLLVGASWLEGWSGLWMVWDRPAARLAAALATFLDRLHIAPDALGRMVTGLEPPPSSFFFFNLFLHVAVPLGLLGLTLLHVARLARPRYLAPAPVSWGAVLALALVALLWPLPAPEAIDPFRLGGRSLADLWYEWPIAALTTWWGIAALVLLAAGLVTLPRWWRPRELPPPATVPERLCTGCTQCWQDCPFEAIQMVPPRTTRRGIEVVAVMDPERCVRCTICIGSCSPMSAGPPDATGRDQRREALARLRELTDPPNTVVLVHCAATPPLPAALTADPAVHRWTVPCAGGFHAQTLATLLDGGVAGVVVAHCPEGGAPCREGPRWLRERLYADRDAELPARYDRDRIRLIAWAPGQEACLRAALTALHPATALREVAG